MNAKSLKDLFRSEIDDTVAPYLWSDGEVAAYMDDALKMFCREVGGILDSSSSMCSVDIEVGEPFADIDQRILRVRRIQRDSDAKRLTLYSIEDADAEGIRLTTQQGPVEIVITGIEQNKLRWVRVPAYADTASLMVERLPLQEITDTFKQPLEIEPQHHQHLLLWMKHRAYLKQDSDTFDQRKADDFEARFMRYCATAKTEKEVKRHKTRTVRYGGL